MPPKEVHSLEELQKEAQAFAQTLSSRASGATLLTLSGELGAGKTTFTQAFAKGLGVTEVVNSPTFVLEKIYQLPAPMRGFTRLVHIDAYRLSQGSDLAPLGFDALMKDVQNLILLEWPERVHDGLPVPVYALRFEAHTDGSRTISYA